jgi:uncharacterized protein YqeY
MSLQARISQELKAAMLARDADRLSTLRLLKSALGYVQIERKTEELPDADVVALIQKEVKKRRDSIEQFEKGGRAELAARVIQELGATGKKDMGPVIKAVQAKAAGRADGKTISGLVGKLLP